MPKTERDGDEEIVSSVFERFVPFSYLCGAIALLIAMHTRFPAGRDDCFACWRD